MNRPSTPVWLPRWDDDSAYPKSWDDWSLGKWVWEFLRRNSEYQNDFAHFASIPGFYPEGGKTPKWSGKSMMQGELMIYRYCDPPALHGETEDGYWKRNDGKVVKEMALEGHLMEKWGIVNLPDPSDDEGYKIIGRLDDMPPYDATINAPDISGWQPPLPSPDEQYHVTLRFDLRFEDLEGQLTEARKILNERREWLSTIGDPDFKPKRSSAAQVAKLPKFLRAFDADAVGVKPTELAKKLCPEKMAAAASMKSGEQDARRAINAGVSLVNGGYKDLMMFK